jgi:hypothetical protein
MRRASYGSPPQFSGGTVARGTPTRHNLGATSEEKEKPYPQPSLARRFVQNTVVQKEAQKNFANLVMQHRLQP